MVFPSLMSEDDSFFNFIKCHVLAVLWHELDLSVLIPLKHDRDIMYLNLFSMYFCYVNLLIKVQNYVIYEQIFFYYYFE